MSFVTPLLLVAAAMLVASALAWRQRRQPILAWYAGVSFFSAIWPLNLAFEVLAQDWTLKVIILHLRPLLITSLCTCFLGMMLEYSGVFALYRRRLGVILLWAGLFVGGLPLLDLSVGGFFNNVHQAVTQPYRMLWQWGPVGAAYEAYLNILLATGLVALWAPARRRGPAYRRSAVILTSATLLPTLANVFYALPINPWPDMNLTSFANGVSNIIWLWVVLGRRAFELIPLGRTAALDHMSDLLFILDADGRLSDCNVSAVTALALPGGKWVGCRISALPAPWPDVLGNPDRKEFEHNGRDFHVTREPLRSANGLAAGWLILLHDVSDLKRAEERLREAHHLEMVGRLAGGVAHGFNNYLTVILGHSALLRELPPEPDILKGSLEAIEGASRDAASLTAQLLALSRRQVLRSEPLDVNDAINGVEKLLRQVLGGRVRLQIELAEDLPKVELDRQHFERCLLEFGLNCRDAMPQGGRLSVSTRAAGESVQVVLEDNGPGIESALLGRVFEPFFTTKDHALHSGLGLSVVHGFINQSGGSVEAFSQAGSGARFVISLPAAKPGRKLRGATD